jgi:hypothetical protein
MHTHKTKPNRHRIWGFFGQSSTRKVLSQIHTSTHAHTKTNAHTTAGDPSVKAALEKFSPEDMQAAHEQIEKEKEGCWKAPPPPPDPSELVPKTSHSCRIGLRGLADTLDTVRKERKRQSVIVDLNGNAQTYLR